MQQINSPEDLKKLFDYQKENIKKIASAEAQKIAEEVVENEWDLFEFNLFVSSIGKEHLDDASDSIKKLRAMEKEGKINLKEFEDLADNF